jgi:hypothetical protein
MPERMQVLLEELKECVVVSNSSEELRGPREPTALKIGTLRGRGKGLGKGKRLGKGILGVIYLTRGP